MRKVLLFLAVISGLSVTAQPLWMRYNVISPDGSKVAFVYKGDIYVVDSRGGTARQLTTHAAYDFNPIWSHDGSMIAFASDRHGNFDVYVMSSEGGVPTRITTNSVAEMPLAFSSDDKTVYYSAALQKSALNVQFTSGWLTELYNVPIDGGRPTQVVDVPVCSMSLDADGESFLYYDRKGSEDPWRKHQVSSIARDIVYYDAKQKKHTILTQNIGEDRDPRFLPGNKDIVYLSERDGGSFNVYKAPVDNVDKAVALTHFTTHPVRFLSVSNQGLLCYGYMGEIYTQTIGEKPKKLDITIVNDQSQEQVVRKDFKGASDFAISDDGKQIAFISRGELFVTTANEYLTTKRITNTVEAERSPSFSPDGKTIVYASERNGYWNIFTAALSRDDETEFAYSTIIEETPLFPDDGVERFAPSYSPDGKEIAYIEGRNILRVYNIATGKSRSITDGTQHYRNDDYGFAYQWSPDGRWFVVELITNMRDPYSDIAVVPSDGSMTTYNITNSAYIDGNPTWVLDGNAILYRSNRYGMRSHASWGSQNDAFLAFLNQESYDKFCLTKEEYSLLKDDKKSDMADKDNKKDSKDRNKEKEIKPLEFELDRVEDRIVRLTPMSSSLSGMALSKDGAKLYFLSSFEKGYDLWEYDTRDRSSKIMKKMGGRGAYLSLDKKGDALFMLSGGDLQRIETKGGKSTAIKYDATMTIDLSEERLYMFNHVFLQQEKRLFLTNNNGVDLALMKAAYEPFLSHINNNYDFSEMLSEVLGELNVSHSGSGYRANVSNGDATAYMGLLLDLEYDGDGLKIEEVLRNGPFDVKGSKMKTGVIIEKIDGIEVLRDEDYYPLLNKKAGKKVLFDLYDPSTKQRWSEVAKLISRSENAELMYKRWVRNNEMMVEQLSGGRLGYVHIKSMGDASYRDVYSLILGKYNLCDGIVIDTRFNGGGRLHEDIEVLFSGEKYLEQVIRDSVACVMPSRRYNKPSIMIIGEANYSNAHGTPWVYKYKNMGSLVGMPVPGTMSSVTWETLQDPSLYFGLPVVGYRTEQGEYLENLQLEPDYKVRNTPEKLSQGVDEQLEKAVQQLLEELDDFYYWGK